MKRLALLLTLLAALVGTSTPANAGWPCWVVRSYAAAQGLGPPLTEEKKARIKALVRENGVSRKDQETYAACFKDDGSNGQQVQHSAKAQGPKAQRYRKGRGHR